MKHGLPLLQVSEKIKLWIFFEMEVLLQKRDVRDEESVTTALVYTDVTPKPSADGANI